jgi:hypothetical protein
MSFCWLLSRAYPLAIWNNELPTFWGMTENLNPFKPNLIDYFRTPPYAIVLHFAQKSSDPSTVLCWTNFFLFSVNIALSAVVSARLFASKKWGAAVCICLLAFEVIAMHLFFFNLQACADPLFAHLIWLGESIVLLAWMNKSSFLAVAGCAPIGLAVWTKPAGLALLPIFIALAFTMALSQRSIKARAVQVILSLLLLLCPLSYTLVRNAVFYGSAQPSALGSWFLLARVLPMLNTSEQVYDDPFKRVAFYICLRSFEKDTLPQAYAPQADASMRDWRFEPYLGEAFGSYNRPKGPFEFINEDVKRKYAIPGPDDPRFNMRLFFASNREAGALAWRIILAHPLEYCQSVFTEYLDMFYPLQETALEAEKYYKDPAKNYQLIINRGISDWRLWGGDGWPRPHCSLIVSNAFWQWHTLGIPALLVAAFSAFEVLIVNSMLVGSIFMLAWHRTARASFDQEKDNVAMAVFIFCGSAACHSLLVGLVNVTRHRYSIATEPGIHLAFLLMLAMLIRQFLRHWNARLRPDQWRMLPGKALLVLHWKQYNPQLLLFATAASLSLCAHMLLLLACPHGIKNSETDSYWWQITSFLPACSNTNDWFRTIPFGTLLAASRFFRDPAAVVPWIHAAIYAIDIGLCSALAARLLRSNRLGLTVGVTLATLEVMLLGSFYSILTLNAVPLYATCLCAGTCLVLIGWLDQSKMITYAGCTVLGLTATIRPEGISILLLWLCLVSFRTLYARKNKDLVALSIALILLTSPSLILYARNVLVYNHFQLTAAPQYLLLCHVLPLVDDHDQLMAGNEHENKVLLRSLREYERKKKIDPTRLFVNNDIRNNICTAYFPWDRAQIGPFYFIANKLQRRIDWNDNQLMFDMSRLEAELAKRIIHLHAMNFGKLWATEYRELFGNDIFAERSFKFPPSIEAPDNGYRLANGPVAPAQGDAGLLLLIDLLTGSWLGSTVRWLAGWQGIFVHIILMATIFWAAIRRWHQKNAEIDRLSLVCALALLTVVADYGYASYIDVAQLNYSLSGQLLMHFVLILVAIWLGRFLAGLWITLRVKDSVHTDTPLSQTN